MTDLRSLAGLARSLAIYYGRPWRIGRWSRFYSLLLQPGELAFDIGAHVGNRSRALAGAGARVVALEPQALFYSFLRRTMPSGVTALPLAVPHLHIPMSRFDPPSGPMVLVCAHGVRSLVLAAELASLGIPAVSLRGGVSAHPELADAGPG